MSDKKKILYNVCRIVLAVTFIFSGFVKCVDPFGTSLKVGEYFSAAGVEWLDAWRPGISVWLCAAELMMGFMLLFGIRLRLVSTFAMFSMIVFTVTAFVLALWNPVADCGCFGDAVKLTNWQTFFKNLVLLPMSMVVWYFSRPLHFFPFTRREFFLAAFFAILTGGFGTYCYLYGPAIDFLPYKVGTNLPEAIHFNDAAQYRTTLAYRDRLSGRVQEFELTDTTWYDTSRWEYVDTKVERTGGEMSAASIRDFAVFREGEDITDELIYDPSTVYLLCAQQLRDVSRPCARRFGKVIRLAAERGCRVVCVTASFLDAGQQAVFDGERVACYNMDPTTMKTMLRSETGLVVLHDGTITGKYTCRALRPGAL